MTNLDGLCQGGPGGEKYPKTTRTDKATKKQTKRKSGRVLREPHRRHSRRKRRQKRHDSRSNGKFYVCLSPPGHLSLCLCLSVYLSVCLFVVNSYVCGPSVGH